MPRSKDNRRHGNIRVIIEKVLEAVDTTIEEWVSSTRESRREH